MPHRPRAIPPLAPLLCVLSLACSARALDDLARDFGHDAGRPTDPALAPERADVGPSEPDQDVASAPPQAPQDAAVEAPPVAAETAAEVALDLSGEAAGEVGPDAPAAPVIVLVVNLPLDVGDAALASHLRDSGYTVRTTDDDMLGNVDLQAADLVFVAATALSTRVGTLLRALPRPVVVSDEFSFDDMGFVRGDDVADPNDHGDMLGQTSLVIAGAARAVTAGLRGTVVVASQPVDFNWGSPPASAITIATVPGRPDRQAIFLFELGAAMVGLTAPARRVALYPDIGATAHLTANGWALIDAAVTWALD